MSTFLTITLILVLINALCLGYSVFYSRHANKLNSNQYSSLSKGKIYPLKRLETELKKAV